MVENPYNTIGGTEVGKANVHFRLIHVELVGEWEHWSLALNRHFLFVVEVRFDLLDLVQDFHSTERRKPWRRRETLQPHSFLPDVLGLVFHTFRGNLR